MSNSSQGEPGYVDNHPYVEDEYKPDPNACAELGCKETLEYSPAPRKDWYLQMNGDSWCPHHIPDWVDGWRANVKARLMKMKSELD